MNTLTHLKMGVKMAFRLINPALQEYQRTWRDYQVDKNLADEWLESLNRLSCFELVSVCEGHCQCNDKYPKLVLFGSRLVLNSLKQSIVDRVPIQNFLNSCIGSNTCYSLTYTTGISSDLEDVHHNGSIKLSIRRMQPRISEELDASTTIWFEQAVHVVEMFDELVCSLLHGR